VVLCDLPYLSDASGRGSDLLPVFVVPYRFFFFIPLLVGELRTLEPKKFHLPLIDPSSHWPFRGFTRQKHFLRSSGRKRGSTLPFSVRLATRPPEFRGFLIRLSRLVPRHPPGKRRVIDFPAHAGGDKNLSSIETSALIVRSDEAFNCPLTSYHSAPPLRLRV